MDQFQWPLEDGESSQRKARRRMHLGIVVDDKNPPGRPLRRYIRRRVIVDEGQQVVCVGHSYGFSRSEKGAANGTYIWLNFIPVMLLANRLNIAGRRFVS